MDRLAWQMLTLSTPKGRVCAWLAASMVVFVVPYAWLANLSLWQRLGWETAPSIGLTRAYWLTLHGQPFEAWDRNWLIVPVLVVGLSIIVHDLVLLSSHHKSSTLTLKN